ncbi:MAG: glycosyltransferase family 4 protein [Chloroflexi bacterium]|nr:glycosyltransferase family 4 protein [Chloroflexota bacterium]
MTDPKKALIVVENCYPPLDIRVWYEALTLHDAGWQVMVICPTAPDASTASRQPEDLERVLLYRFVPSTESGGMAGYAAEYGRAFWAIARLSWRVWREQGFDVIHLCNPPDIFFPIALFYRLRGARVIFDHHDLFPEMIRARYRGVPGRLLYVAARAAEFLTFHSAHVVLSTNESYRRVALERGHKPPGAVFTVRNGPRLSAFAPVPTDPALKQGFAYMVCYAGVMGQQDGLTDLLNAIYHVINDLGRRDILFTLLGDGEARPDALATIDRWGFGDVVSMPGMIRDRALLRRYLASADVCVSPEPYNKINAASTFIKIGEYMAMGRPVVCYDLPESRYTAQEAAIYATPGDPRSFGQAIVTLIDDPERHERMGAAGRERVTTCLAWEHQQQHLLRAYDAALDRTRAKPQPSREATINDPKCQLQSVSSLAESDLDTGPQPLLRRAKLALKRQLSPSTKRRLKQRVARWQTRLASARGNPPPEPVSLPRQNLNAGDLVRVRTREEIAATLNQWQEFKGCGFMEPMWDYCGTTQRVLKPVRQFLDERDYRMKACRGIVLLENVTCNGLPEYGPCDRGCFIFWREEWLKKLEQGGT